MDNLYNVLELNDNASQEEIKKSYRRLSLLFHPDRNNNSPESTVRFQKISSAYETLSDEEKRKNYDIQLKGTFQSTNFQNFFNQPNKEFDATDILNFFSRALNNFT